MSDSLSKRRPFSFSFNWGSKAKSQGANSGEKGGWRTIHMLLLVTDSGFHSCVGWRFVVMKESVVVAPKFRSFLLHIFSQSSQNVTVKVRVDRSVVRRNKFTVKNPFHIEKNIMSMPFVELRTCRAFFSSWLWWALPL
jgi:hypothetical protein